MKIIVTGTDTAVGKTYICILLGKYLERKNIDFLIYKPFATGTIITDTGKKEIEDIYLYKKYLNLQLNKNLFVYKTFNFPNAPTIASQLDKKKT
ncbi:MAG: AAA family ATPase [Planctomycetota bacterium]